MVGGNLSKPITEMTIVELKSYLADHRNDKEKFSQAMGELLKKLPSQEKWHPPFINIEDAEKYFQQNPLQ
jgi:hypothetical protein